MIKLLSAVLAVIIIVVPGPGGSGQPTPTPNVPPAASAQPPPVAGSSARRPATSAGGSAAQVAPMADGGGAGGSVQPVRLVSGAGRTVRVTDAASLASALAAAAPGQTIDMADGNYPGRFVINRAGEPDNPITLRGSRAAVIDGGPAGPSGYDLHLQRANNWQLVGFTVTGGQKGIMADQTNNTVLSGLDVGNTGDEGVHFGNFSSDNVVQDSVVHDTGKVRPGAGEGLYFGTAKASWATQSNGRPDRSNNNKAINNTFRKTASENIEVKEETSGGLIAGNAFDGSGLSGQNDADSVLDLKGTGYRILDNVTSGTSPYLKTGFQTQVVTSPASSGCGNTFLNNVFVPPLSQVISLDPRCGPQ
ncbi:MAG TPA: hypothetical protein VGH89_34650 [Pseudonocardia sp.]